MIYNIHYDVSAMAISLFAILFTIVKKGLHKRQNKILLALLAVCFLASLFDITSSIGNSHIVQWSIPHRDFHNYAYLLLHNCMPYLVSLYIVALTGMNFGRSKNAFLHRLHFLPVAFSVLLLTSNLFTRKVFYYDGQGIYTHGPLFPILFILAYFYFVLCIFLLFRFGKNVSASKKGMALLFLIASLVSVVAQMLLPTILLQLCVESLCLMGMVIVVDNEDEVLDVEYGCYNRKAFIYDFYLYQHNDTTFPLIIVKLERLTAYANTIGIVSMGQLKRRLGDFLKSRTKNAECYYVENDTFILICNSKCDADTLQKEIKKGFEGDWQIDTYQLKLEAQVYRALVPDEIRSIEEVLMLIAPEHEHDPYGSGQYRREEQSLPDGAEQKAAENVARKYKQEQELEEAIRRALRYGNIEVHYQPIWNGTKNRITSCEALIRLTDEKLGPIPAGTMMQIIAQKGYGRELEKYLLEKVCSFIKDHPLEEAGLERVGTNLSRELLLDVGLREMIDEIVDAYGIPHEKLGFEFSGAPMIRNDSAVQRTLESLKNSGYVLIMDRFGAGYTDIMDLAEFPVSVIKFDNSFLKKIITNRRAYTIMIYSVKMSKRLGFSTVVVGVEQEEEKDIMTNLGCENIQGYYFSPALPAEDFYRYSMGFNGE